eukprot:CAMPEP_0182466676 /NCGR_PEP_ID=MMETSP1319-20130603/12505_1 /TAXON_ID=172717 /ORGANISM="Bolidomonas pacifica, Strain RCC208" /LENGTH=341 /DNA_ID=CAMNT_0024666703 /DNA_START=175 /DNA_END=1197 /DNA_ORIENTATION=-
MRPSSLPLLILILILILPTPSTPYTNVPSTLPALDYLSNYVKVPLPPPYPRKAFLDVVLNEVESSTRLAFTAPNTIADVPPSLQVLTPQERTMATADSSRKRMTKAYAALRSLGVVRKYGAVASAAVPAPDGSAFFTVEDMEGRLGLSMSSLTPRSSETFDPYFAAGIALAVLETYVSLVCHVPAVSLFLLTAVPLTLDRFLLNGAVGEAILRRLDPGQREKVVRHEAGHFLVSYLLGCPVEGVVLSSLEAFSDGRFGGLAGGVAAGTSFFDDRLSAEIGRGEITRGTIDRYAAIVMAGIASEALKYDKAEGGASDEEALVRFLTSLEGRRGYDRERIKEQ